METFMANTTERREKISTRIERDALALIESAARAQRTTPAQVARVLLEDAARDRFAAAAYAQAAAGERGGVQT
jgi:hypothetical protein